MQEITVNLHNHSSFSRGEQKYHSLAQAGLTAGIDVLIVTDANVYVSGKEQYYYRDERRLLLLTGEEVFRSFPNDTGHMLILNGGREMANQADTPQQLINFCSQWEGLTIIAHPFDGLTEREVLTANREGLISGRADSARSPLNSPWVNWEIQNFTGIEILNLQSEYKTAGQRRRFGLSDFFIRSTGVDRLTHASLAALQKWDEFLTAGRRVAAYCGSACVNFAQWAAVCQTNGIDAHFSHQRRIFFMMLQVQRVAYFASVLMAAYPAKRQMLAVEDKPQIGVNPVKTKP